MSDDESDVFSTIMAFEQILEVMPDDRSALESVAHAYDELGDHIQAKNYIMRLVRVLLDESNTDEAAEWVDKLRAHAEDDPGVKTLIEEMDAIRGGSHDGEQPTAGDATGPSSQSAETLPQSAASDAPKSSKPAAANFRKSVRMQLNLADEMAFAWNLLQVELLSDDEYASVVTDLTELTAGKRSGTVSVLHVLRGRGFSNLDKILVTVSRDAYMPLINLQLFDIQREAAQSLPLEFIVQRGALPFERIGSEILVALLNPFDENLRKDITTLAESKCHWFLTSPDGFDKAVDAIQELLA